MNPQSYSSIQVFNNCKYQYYLRYINKAPQESIINPASQRGTDIHKAAEDYINNKVNLSEDLSKFIVLFEELKDLALDSLCITEKEWGFDANWQPATWDNCVIRAKIDAVAFSKDLKTARVIDFKTGKRKNNEFKHTQQVLFYAMLAFIRYPDLELVQTELWYLDLGELHKDIITRDRIPKLMFYWQGKLNEINESCETNIWPHNSNEFSCKWCEYGSHQLSKTTKGSGRCFNDALSVNAISTTQLDMLSELENLLR